MSKSEELRVLLASVGIFISDPVPVKPPAIVELRNRKPTPSERKSITEILIAAGAPDRDIEWLVNSCPSIDAALGYSAA